MTRISLDSLKVGRLAQGGICVLLKLNRNKVTLLRRLQPVDEKFLAKAKKLPEIYTEDAPLGQRYPRLQTTTDALREILNDQSSASFEKGAKIRENLGWAMELICPFFIPEQTSSGVSSDKEPSQIGLAHFLDLEVAVWLCVETLDAPGAELLSALSDLSVVVFERSLLTAATAGILALLLGYNEPELLKSFIGTVFAAEWGVFRNKADGSDATAQNEIEKLLAPQKSAVSEELARYQRTCELIRKGLIPGLTGLDHRLGCLLSQAVGPMGTSDPLVDIFRFARSLTPFHGRNAAGISQHLAQRNSVMGKLKRITDLLWPGVAVHDDAKEAA